MSSSAPQPSRPPSPAGPDFGTTRKAATAPTAAIGTPTQNTARQSKRSSSRPPSTGPRQTPIAWAAAILVLASAVAPGGFDLAVRLAALAVFGGSLGLFIAPNNNMTLKAAPEHLTGSAGGLLNLMRMIGCGLGIAFASAVLSWRLGTSGGATTVGVDEAVLLSAVAGSLLVPAAFALIAAAAALLHRRDEARAAEPAAGAQQ